MKANIPVIFKVIELAVAILCMVLWDTLKITTNNPMFICGTVGAFVVACIIVLLGHLINSSIEKNLCLAISLAGCFLFIFAGSSLINEWRRTITFKEVLGSFGAEDKLKEYTGVDMDNPRHKAYATGSVMITNGVIFLVDTFFIFKI